MIQSVYEGSVGWEDIEGIPNTAYHSIALGGLLNVKTERVMCFYNPTAIVSDLLPFQAHYLKGC